MTILYFVRHAHSTYSPDERMRPLSEKGVEGAHHLCKVFQDIQVDRFYSSPYRRAVETIAPLATERRQDIVEVEALRERLLAPGELAGFQEAVTYVWQHPDQNPYGGETNEEATDRIRQFIDQLLVQHPEETLVLGTHGNIMVLLLQAFDCSFDYSFWKSLPMPAVCRLGIDATGEVDIRVIPLNTTRQ